MTNVKTSHLAQKLKRSENARKRLERACQQFDDMFKLLHNAYQGLHARTMIIHEVLGLPEESSTADLVHAIHKLQANEGSYLGQLPPPISERVTPDPSDDR